MNKELEDIIKRIESKGVKIKKDRENKDEVRILEDKIGCKLPETYRKSLIFLGGIDSGDELIVFNTEDMGVGKIYEPDFYTMSGEGLDSLVDAYDDYVGRVPEELIPIGSLPFGDVLCIGVKGRFRGKVYYWNHEKEFMDAKTCEQLWNPVTEVNDNFYQFITGIETEGDDDDDDEEREEGEVNKMEVSEWVLKSVENFKRERDSK